MNSDVESNFITREQKVMKSFLKGKLHLGSSLNIIHNGKQISFAMKGKDAMRLKQWWIKRGVHYTDHIPQLSRDLDYRRPPYDKVQIVLTPAELHDHQGKVKTCSVKEHKDIEGAPKYSLHDLDRSVGHMNLLHFVAETLRYKEDMDKMEAERLANIRPFITPKRVEPIQPRFTLSECNWDRWSLDDQDVKVPEEAIKAEADQVAARAVIMHNS